MSIDTPVRPAGNDPVTLAKRDLVIASRVLAREGILDGFGHVSLRHPLQPDRYLIPRSVAPALVEVDDIVALDLDSNPVPDTGAKLFIERFIHGEIFKRRPDVNAVVHSHSPTTIPFGVTGTPLQPICHMSGFLAEGQALFEIRDCDENNDMLIRNPALGAALAETLGARSTALMRGHGNVVVATDIRAAVYRAVYCELNAKLQLQARQLGEPRYLSPAESANSDATNMKVVERPWRYWAERAGCGGLLDP